MTRTPDAEKVGALLSWKKFEEYAEQVFNSFDFETSRNLRFKKPTMELDLLASKGDLGFAVDCKHWKRTVGQATMLRIGSLQVKRSKRVFELEGFKKVIPVILTLHDEMLHVLESGVAIVPIQKISDFVLNWEFFRHSLCILEDERENLQMKL
ncbi:MAG: restriction endonuclease [Nitrososphaerales archaeon]